MNAIKYRRQKVRDVPTEIGVYALCDLDGVPIYVGQSVDGIQSRVRRHLTSARSDIIANRQIDVWEIAYVWAWPLPEKTQISELEAWLFHEFASNSELMNGSIPADPSKISFAIPEKFVIQIIDDEEIEARLDPSVRMPRQIQHIERLVDHIPNVKNTVELKRSLKAHYARLTKYYDQFLDLD